MATPKKSQRPSATPERENPNKDRGKMITENTIPSKQQTKRLRTDDGARRASNQRNPDAAKTRTGPRKRG